MGVKLIRHEGMNVTGREWDEYDYLFDLIIVEKRNPYFLGYHPREEKYPLMKKIAISEISSYQLRNSLVAELEE